MEKTEKLNTPKLFIVVNEDRFFLSHREDIGKAASREGWDVTVVCKDTGMRGRIEAMGLKFVDLPINPTGMQVKEELKLLNFLRRLYRRHPDAIVHHVGLKLLLWGSVAAWLSPVKATVNAVSGMGTLFTGKKPSKLGKLVFPVLRFCKRKNSRLLYIFQNEDDRGIFADHHLLDHAQTVIIKGAGVNLSEYPFTPLPEGDPKKIVFAGRMLREKGVLDLVKAAEKLRIKYEGKAEFLLCGPLSSNPSALNADEISRLIDGSYIQWLDNLEDVRPILKESSIFCLPSHREGFPKASIEASAIGRPIVTFDTVGCRDTVEDGFNGFKVELEDSQALAEKIEYLIEHPEECARMGANSRKIAEKTYDIKEVIDKHLEIYSEMRK